MSVYDQIFAGMLEEDKARLLAEATLRKHNPAARQFESAEAFNAHVEPPLTYLVDGLIARGQLAMLGGRSKSGKSWLVAQLAQSLDTGRPFLGRAVQPARVLYLALEDKRNRLKRRTKMLGWTPKTTTFEYSFPHFNGPNGQFGPGLELIEHVAWDYDVILIDTLIATLDAGISENDNTSMGAIGNELATMAHDLDCAILLVHHIGKGISDDVFNLLRGASALRGAYDVGLLLDRKQGEREAVLHVEARDFEGVGLTIRQREGGQGWDLLGEAKEMAQIRVGRRVIEALAEFEGGASADELAESLSLSKPNVFRQLKRGERDGHVVLLRTEVSESAGRPTMIWGLAGQAGAGTSQPNLFQPPSSENEAIKGDKSDLLPE